MAATEKVTLTLPKDLMATVREMAPQRGISRFVSDALEYFIVTLRRQVLREGLERAEGLSERERLLAELETEGLIRDLTPQERVHAERWRALPEEEKQAHIRLMNSLVLDPPLSQIIIENRR